MAEAGLEERLGRICQGGEEAMATPAAYEVDPEEVAVLSTQGSPCTPRISRTWSPRSKIGQRTTRRKAVAETRAAALGVAGRVGVVPMVKAAAAGGVLSEAWALWE